jgi:uncharacterized protein (TIGR02145 family)
MLFFTDTRDGKKYAYLTIGTQTWMAQNLNYETGGRCYEDLESNCDTYGRLYDWETALTVCPAGWHLPSNAEWTALINFVGDNPGTKLKATSGWNNENGEDSYGFAAIPGGSRYSSGFLAVGDQGCWWSTYDDNNNNNNRAYNIYIYYSSTSWDYNYKSDLYSVRCVRSN